MRDSKRLEESVCMYACVSVCGKLALLPACGRERGKEKGKGQQRGDVVCAVQNA